MQLFLDLTARAVLADFLAEHWQERPATIEPSRWVFLCRAELATLDQDDLRHIMDALPLSDGAELLARLAFPHITCKPR